MFLFMFCVLSLHLDGFTVVHGSTILCSYFTYMVIL